MTKQNKDHENLHAGHRERMRQRFLKNGLMDFPEHEVLEILLFFSIRRGNTNEIAHRLLRRFGSLYEVLCADGEDLREVEGVGECSVFLLRFIGALMQYVEYKRLRGMSLRCFEDRFLYFRTMLSDCTDENLLVACLDDQFCVKVCCTVAKGSAGHVHADPQTLMRTILNQHCSNVILAHNHPAGMAMPSYEDIMTTNHIARMLRNVSVELVDHIIIAGEDACSMRQTGSYEPSAL